MKKMALVLQGGGMFSESAAAPAGGDHDFWQYGVRKACEAGRSTVAKHFQHTFAA